MSQSQNRKLFRLGYLVIIALLTVIMARAWPEQPIEVPARQQEVYEVSQVLDGDTIEIARDGKLERVRLIGVDTPETKDPRKPVQCFGKEASKHTETSLSGRRVRLEFDPVVGERDRYDRLLAYVWREDGLFVNLDLVTEGFAHEYTYQHQLYKYRDEFQAAERAADSADKGLWAANTCNGVTT